MHNFLSSMAIKIPRVRNLYDHRNHLLAVNDALAKERDRLLAENEALTKDRDRLLAGKSEDCIQNPLLQKYYQDEQYIVNCFGARLARDTISKWTKYFEKNSSPQIDENYLEYVDVLTAVDNAEKSFTMVELGAGFGR